MPKLSIIIPTYMEEQFIERTLKNFAGLALPHEIIITDGGSTDKTLELVRTYTNKVVVWDRAAKGRRQRIGEARNLGAAVAQSEFFVFIDADVIIPEPQKFFSELLVAFDKNRKLVAVTTPLRPLAENHSLIDSLLSMPLNGFYILVNNLLHIGSASGEFQMIRAEAFRKLGGFNGEMVTAEDNDMFMRLSKIGRTLSYNKLFVTHTLRRPHKIGWLKLYGIWIKNGFVGLFKKSAEGEWELVR